MELKDVKAFLETNKDNEEVKNYLSELSKVTSEGVENYILTEEGKKWLGRHQDSFFTKGLETWKKNNLKKIVDEEIKKRNPGETEEQKKIRELEERLNQKEAAEKRQILLNKSLQIASEKKLPVEILDYFLGEDEESTMKNIEKLETVLNKQIETAVNERLKNGDYTPPCGDKGNGDYTLSSAIEAYYKK